MARALAKNNRQVPQFWVEFYKQNFDQAISVSQLQDWRQAIGIIKFAFSPAALQELRHFYSTS